MSLLNTLAHSNDGYLLNANNWTPDYCLEQATALEITMTDEKWAIIDQVRDFYHTHQYAPNVRMLIQMLRKNLLPNINSLKLQDMFNHKPALIISKLAGLPKPKHCI